MNASTPAHDGPPWPVVVWRATITAVWLGVVLLVLAGLLPGFTIDGWPDALLAGIVVGLLNAVIWPALSVVVVPISVLTLGVGAILIDALVVGWVLNALPGVQLADFGTQLAVAIGLVVVSTAVSSVLAIDDDAVFDREVRGLVRRRRRMATTSEVPGIVFIQVDGLARSVFERALRSGDVPTLRRWLASGSHHLAGWTTGWSSQTGVSQCGILHGSTTDMPAFRWVDKAADTVVVSNHPASAHAIEQAHSDGNGLLAHHGSSYGNLFSGDAERAVMTMSVVTRRKEGRIGAGYGAYFARPQQAIRTFVGVVTEVVRERRAALSQRRRGVEPRIERGWTYAAVRAFTTIISRDVSVAGVVNDMAEGRAAIYVDFLGYDEVAHHSGPERVDTLAVLRDLDLQIGRIARAAERMPRPYRIVVLSDHGQTQGPTFEQRAGETLTALVTRLCGEGGSGDADAEDGRTESSAWLRPGRGSRRSDQADRSVPLVLASGNLALVSLPGEPRRLTREEIDERYPQLIPGLLAAPAVGFLLVRSQDGSSSVLGPRGVHNLVTGVIEGEDPLAPFGPLAPVQVAEVDGYRTVADLMVNSILDARTGEVAAFEDQVSSHGGLGGPQTHPFLLYPASLSAPPSDLLGSPAVHRVLKGWLREVGQPVDQPVGQPVDPSVDSAADRVS